MSVLTNTDNIKTTAKQTQLNGRRKCDAFNTCTCIGSTNIQENSIGSANKERKKVRIGSANIGGK